MFYLAKIELGRINVPEPEYLVAAADIKAGAALKIDANGKVALCSGTTKPTYVSLADAKSGETVAVGRVRPDNIYDVPASVAITQKVGAKLTIHTDGLQVTNTTEGGVATIVDLLGASKAGDLVRVRFE